MKNITSSLGLSIALVLSVTLFTHSATAVPLSLDPVKPGDVVKSPDSYGVYYIGLDKNRYIFPNLGTFKTWFKDFSAIRTVPTEKLATFRLKGTVAYKPGSKLVKMTSDHKVYIVDCGELRWVQSVGVVKTLYGKNWNKKLDTVPDTLFAGYRVGAPITSASQYNPELSAANCSLPGLNRIILFR